MYIHSGKAYRSFTTWAWLEGMRLFFLLLICLGAVASPFIISGKLQKALEKMYFYGYLVHFASAPTTTMKSVYIEEAAQDARAAGIPPQLFVRQIALASGFNPNQVSGAGAVGIAQLLPDTAAQFGIDPYDPQSALKGAAQLMAGYQRTYAGDYAKALAAYVAGLATVNVCVAHFGPLWEKCLPQDIQRYLAVIING